jgi:hypothetical protein
MSDVTCLCRVRACARARALSLSLSLSLCRPLPAALGCFPPLFLFFSLRVAGVTLYQKKISKGKWLCLIPVIFFLFILYENLPGPVALPHSGWRCVCVMCVCIIYNNSHILRTHNLFITIAI